MKSSLAVALVAATVLLAGCAGTAVGLRSTNSPSMGAGVPPPGTSRGAGWIQAEVRPNAYFGLLFLGYVMTGMVDTYRHWSDGPGWSRPPELALDRTVVERDCSQPLGPLDANLRCR